MALPGHLGVVGDPGCREVQWVLATGEIDRVRHEGSQALGEETIPAEHRRGESQDREGNQADQNADRMVDNSLEMEVVEDTLEEVGDEALEVVGLAVDLEDLDLAEAQGETYSVDIAVSNCPPWHRF